MLKKHAGAFSDAMSDHRYREAAQEADAKYRHWAKIRYIARAGGLNPELLWLMVKLARSGRYRSLRLSGGRGSPVQFTVPAFVQEELMHIDQQLAGQLGSDDDHPPSETAKERYIVRALREEAIASSMLEGAATTRREAKEMLREGRRPRSHGEQMVYNNYQAISFIRENRATPLSTEFLLEVQRIITDGTLDRPEDAGRIRGRTDKVQVVDQFGEVLHDPPDADELPRRIQELCAFANGESDEAFIHPVVRACVLQYQLGFDHPFCDGNGRTARAIFYWSMLRAGYWLFEYLPISSLIYESPGQYGLAYLYTESDEFDVTYFLMYKARVLRRARRQLREFMEKKQRDMIEARRVFEDDRRLNHRQRSLITRLLRNPQQVVTIKSHQGRHTVAYGTARSDLLDLADWGYLVKGQRANRFEFEAGPRLSETT